MGFFKKEDIESFEIITLHLGGMRGLCEYEIVMKDGLAEVSFYDIRCSQEHDERILRERATCDVARMLSLLNDCRVLSWDGFDGPHPKWVLDGTMFRFTATVNGDRKIYAHGSENFPRHYHDFESGLREILRNTEKTE